MHKVIKLFYTVRKLRLNLKSTGA